MRDWLFYRSQFDSLNECHHLISNSLGAMPNGAREHARRYLDTWAGRGVRAWQEEWMAQSGRIGNKIAALMNARPETVSMHPNVTSAEAVVLSCFEFDGLRDKVVMVDMEFPSIIYLYREWLQGRGRLEIVPGDDGISIPLDRLLEAIDERTLLVPISHVLFRSSCIMDAQAVIEKAHKVGAFVVLDVFQSLGSVPVDMEGWNADFAVGGCLKWLCGGPGACFLYVRPDLQPLLNPRFTGWFSHARPFEFDIGPIVHTEGASRFVSGTPVVPALYTCQAGLDIVSEIGVERIRRRSTEMSARLLEQAHQRGWKTTTPADPEDRAGTVAIDLPDGARITAELLRRDFLVDYRPKAGIRISPHFYNTDDELDAVVVAIEEIA